MDGLMEREGIMLNERKTKKQQKNINKPIANRNKIQEKRGKNPQQQNKNFKKKFLFKKKQPKNKTK